MALVPNSQIVADFVALDEQKRIIIDCGNHTSVPGIFAAGDVTNTYAEQVLVAVGEGAKAALSAYEYSAPIDVILVMHVGSGLFSHSPC